MTSRTDENQFAFSQGANSPSDEVYAGVLRRVVKRVQVRAGLLHQDYRKAEVVLGEILRQPLAHRYLLMGNSSRYQSWFVGDRLLQYCEEKWFVSPREALEVADLVRFATHHLNPAEGEGVKEDLRARAWAYRGNCLRILGDLVGADAAFEVAERCRGRGTGDAMVEARLADLEASLRSVQGRCDHALSLLRRALVIYTRAEDRHQQGRVLVGQAKVQLDQGNSFRAEWLLRRGLRWIEASRDPRLVLVARHNLVCCALASGDLRRARRMLRSCKIDFPIEEGEALETHRQDLKLQLDWALEAADMDPGSVSAGAREEGEKRHSAARSTKCSWAQCSVPQQVSFDQA